MTANLPQNIQQVEALYRKLRREGFISDAAAFTRGAWVQIRTRDGVLCGCVEGALKPREDREQAFVILTEVGDMFVGQSRIRPCGGLVDQRCTCARPDAPAASRAHVRRVPPLGNTGVTA